MSFTYLLTLNTINNTIIIAIINTSINEQIDMIGSLNNSL